MRLEHELQMRWHLVELDFGHAVLAYVRVIIPHLCSTLHHHQRVLALAQHRVAMLQSLVQS